jgi:hypothetical protein
VPVGTAAGVQLPAVLKSELPGVVDQVASWARAGIAASSAIVAVVTNRYARILRSPLQDFLRGYHLTIAGVCAQGFFARAMPIVLRL